jgi:hypothetical protein
LGFPRLTVSDEEWSLVAPYPTLMNEGAPQRQQSLRELFNGVCYVLRYGIAWRAMPNDPPPWSIASGLAAEPTAAIIDSRTLRSTPESGPRAGYDGAKRKRGPKCTCCRQRTIAKCSSVQGWRPTVRDF